MEQETIIVPVTFTGNIEVFVDKNAPNKAELARVIALSRVIASTENPDAPDEDAMADYAAALGIPDNKPRALKKAEAFFDRAEVGSCNGTWSVL